jgi:dipeptidyl-peptidase-3
MAAHPNLLKSGFEIGDLHPEKIIADLQPDQLKYATYLCLAAWAGYPIVAAQVSRDTLGIHDFLSTFIRTYPRDVLEAAASQPGTPLFYLLEYAAQFYYNCAQYFGFGDDKFIPLISKEDLLSLSEPYSEISAKLTPVIDSIYSATPPVLTLGFAPNNTTAYYEPEDFTQEEQLGVDAVLKQVGIPANNTVIVREPARYNVVQFSIEIDEIGKEIGTFNSKPVVVTKGRFSEVLRKVNHWLTLAKDSALNPIEAEALEHLIKHNETGDLNEHILYSELWVKDSEPIVESYQGVIESYRDPSGVRCEFEAFVAAVDPGESRFLHAFVEAADQILPLLPYPKEYERDSFTPPSYNALNILTFCTSGLPIGINIPNYDEIRLNKGFKNVSLSNVLAAAHITAIKFPFLTETQLPALIENFGYGCAFNVATHELYGHGSGKLLKKVDVERGVPDLLNPGRQVQTYYEEGENYQDVFGGFGQAFEECRAETTSLHLTFKDSVLELYGVPPEKRVSFKVCETLAMLHSGMKSLVCYIPDIWQWKQAHAQARFAILRAILFWGRGAASVKAVDGSFKLYIDPENFDGVIDAVELLLKHLNYYKAIRAPEQAKEFFGSLTSLDDFWLSVREKAQTLRLPRAVECGAVIKKVGDDYTLARPGGTILTVLDVASSIVESIALAIEV